MPIVSRENPGGWLLRAERFFDLHKYSKADRLEVVVVAFKGNAMLWYLWESKCRSILKWDELWIIIKAISSIGGREPPQVVDGPSARWLSCSIPSAVHSLCRIVEGDLNDLHCEQIHKWASVRVLENCSKSHYR